MRKKFDVQIVTAASILGLKPTGVEKAPEFLLSEGLEERLNPGEDVINVSTFNHLYLNERDHGAILNASSLRLFSEGLNKTIRDIDITKKFALALGGDCSVLIGIMSALKSKGTFGLFFLDAHADFYEPEKSITGEAADMDLAIITGRGPDLLTNINSAKPYVRDSHVIHIGQRDMEETRKFHSRQIQSTEIKCIDFIHFQQHGIENLLNEIKEYVKRMKVDGFWIHFDTDVIDDDENPAVDYRLPGGMSFHQCEVTLENLLQVYPTVGMSVTIFNPNLDPYGKVSKQIVSLISNVLA